MRRFMLNLALAIVWMALTASVSEWNFVAGLVIGAAIISVYSGAVGDPPYLGQGLRLLHRLAGFMREIVHSNLKIAWEVLTPAMHQTPRIIRYPAAGLTDAHRTALASAITLTPGTLVIDTSPDGDWLYVHCMYARDRDEAVSGLDEIARLVREGLFQ
ncbi:MAG: Na+/H+ antiporter subunit E [Planctomycetota bacterium]|nr:MAG: Na+/H+ antiporter subunit E [Planctomycetota bacterium]